MRAISVDIFGSAIARLDLTVGNFFGGTVSPRGVRRKAVIGTLPQYPNVEDAWQASNGLRVSINEVRNRQREQAVTVADLVDHYIKTELAGDLGDGGRHTPRKLCTEREHFRREEVRSHHHRPVSTDEILPACALPPFRRRRDIIALEDVAHRLIRNLVTEIRHRAHDRS